MPQTVRGRCGCKCLVERVSWWMNGPWSDGSSGTLAAKKHTRFDEKGERQLRCCVAEFLLAPFFDVSFRFDTSAGKHVGRTITSTCHPRAWFKASRAGCNVASAPGIPVDNAHGELRVTDRLMSVQQPADASDSHSLQLEIRPTETTKPHQRWHWYTLEDDNRARQQKT